MKRKENVYQILNKLEERDQISRPQISQLDGPGRSAPNLGFDVFDMRQNQVPLEEDYPMS